MMSKSIQFSMLFTRVQFSSNKLSMRAFSRYVKNEQAKRPGQSRYVKD